MRANRPSHSSAIRALQKLRVLKAHTPNETELETISEIAQRLRRLDNQVGQLININNSLIEQRVPITEFDPETDTVTTRVKGAELKTKLKRADPNKPIQMRTLAAGGAYRAGRQTSSPEKQDVDEMLFEGSSEDYYHNAHRVLKLVKTIPGLSNFECMEITIVRNKLIEHPEHGEVYSFGFGSSGPVVRPMHKPGREWIDAGLVPNTEAFVKALTDAIERQLSAHGTGA